MMSTPGLEPIRFVTADAEFRGYVSAGNERMTDILQRGQPFRVLPEGATSEPENWLEIMPNEIQLVIPPPHVSPDERRLPRQLREVLVRVGRYEVNGTAHLMPGSEGDILSRSSRPFLPLTNVLLVAEGGVEERHEVVIVNLRETSVYRVA